MKHLANANKRVLLALVCGVIAAIMLALYTNTLSNQASSSRADALVAYGGEQVDVLVATRDISAGESLDANNTSMQKWLADLLPVGAVTSTADAYGKELAVPLLKNEPVCAAKIGSTSGPVSVPDGLVACSVPTDDVSAVGGAITQGASVDVYAVGATTVNCIATGQLVLETSNGRGSDSVGNDNKRSGLFSSSNRDKLEWVTLAVKPELVEQLLVAARDKNLALVLPGDSAPANSEHHANASSDTGINSGTDIG
jgi:pilus assembly protein CpaB